LDNFDKHSFSKLTEFIVDEWMEEIMDKDLKLIKEVEEKMIIEVAQDEINKLYK